MTHRHAISDADFARIKHLLPGRPGQHGGVAKDNRRFLDAVLWIARTGAAWARPARAAGQRQQPVAAVRPLGRQGALGPDPGGPARPGPGRADPRLDRRPRPPLRRRGQKNGTAPAARPSRPSAAAGAGSGRRSTAACDGLGHPVELILTAAPGVGHRAGRGAAGRPRAGGGDRRQGVRQEGAGRGDRGRGAEAVIPTQKDRQGAAGGRPAPVPGAEPGASGSGRRSSSTGGWRRGTRRRRPTSWRSSRWPRSW